jgi:hypothetical protein
MLQFVPFMIELSGNRDLFEKLSLSSMKKPATNCSDVH